MAKKKVRKRRIMIVEPDRELSMMLENFLTAQRFDVTVSASGDDAIKQIEKRSHDIVLLSRELPMKDGKIGPDGLRVLKILKEDRKDRPLPVILCSSDATENDFDRYRNLKFSADDYLSKPFEDSEILRRIENLVGFDLSDSEDMDRIKATIDGVKNDPEKAFFDPATDAFGPGMAAATKNEITQLLEQVGEELDRQEEEMAPEEPEEPAPAAAAPTPEHPPAAEPSGEERRKELGKQVKVLSAKLEKVQKLLVSERKRSRELKKKWKKQLTAIAAKLSESEERESAIRDEFEVMRKRFADIELDHTMELELVHEQKRRFEEELTAMKTQEAEYPRVKVEMDLREANKKINKILKKLEGD